MAIRFSYVVAWPSSSNAITITAAPNCFAFNACALNTDSPSFKEIEFTILFPCTHFNPASITSHLLESIIMGTLAISGSAAIRFRKVVMALTESIMPSSMFTSIICAPFSTC